MCEVSLNIVSVAMALLSMLLDRWGRGVGLGEGGFWQRNGWVGADELGRACKIEPEGCL